MKLHRINNFTEVNKNGNKRETCPSILCYAVKNERPVLLSEGSKLADQMSRLADKRITYPAASGNTAHSLQLLLSNAEKSSSMGSCPCCLRRENGALAL